MMTLLSCEQFNAEEFSLDQFMLEELAFEDFVWDSCEGTTPDGNGLPAQGQPFHSWAIAGAMAVFDWVMAATAADQAVLVITLVEAAEQVCIHTATAWRLGEQQVGCASALREAIAAIVEVQVWLEFAITQPDAGGSATALQQRYHALERHLHGLLAAAERAAMMRLAWVGDRELQEV